MRKSERVSDASQKTGSNKNDAEPDFDMFGSVAYSNHSSDTSSVNQRKNVFEEFEVKKKAEKSGNFDDFLARENQKSQQSEQRVSEKKEDVNFSMFGSMKSDKSKGSVVSSHQVEEDVENRKSFQKKEDVNFSMFGSVKSGHL